MSITRLLNRATSSVVALALLASPAFAEWRLIAGVDSMGLPATIALVDAPGATLRLACKRTGPELIFDQPVAARTVGLNFRFDNGPVVPRVAVVASDYVTVYPWLAAPSSGVRDIARSSRLRVQIFPTGSALTFYDFDLRGGAAAAVARLGCVR